MWDLIRKDGTDLNKRVMKLLKFGVNLLRSIIETFVVVMICATHFVILIPLMCSAVLYASEAAGLKYLEAKYAAYYMPSFALTLCSTVFILILIYKLHKWFTMVVRNTLDFLTPKSIDYVQAQSAGIAQDTTVQKVSEDGSKPDSKKEQESCKPLEPSVAYEKNNKRRGQTQWKK